MQKSPFNSGWRTRRKVNSFLESNGRPPEWTSVTLPHDAVAALDRSPEGGAFTGYSAQGVFEYVKTLHVDADELEGRRELEFDGVYSKCLVYVNGVFAGQHPHGYAPFRVRIDEFLREGPNEIRVEARAKDDSRWYSGAGIYREVAMLHGGPLHIASHGPTITTPDVASDLATVDVAVTVRNDGARAVSARLVVEIRDGVGGLAATAQVPVTAHPRSEMVVRSRVTVTEPDLWNVDQPTLYTCRTALTVDGDELDSAESTFGIRRLQWDAVHGLRINGDRVKLRGGGIHHDNGILGSAAFSRAEERRIELLKAAGFNAVRSAHNPMSTAMLDACDRLGMLVMDEAFDAWTISKVEYDHALDTPEWWRRDIQAMVERDLNHPSVIMYSIGNEIPEVGDPWGARLGRDMVNFVKSIDATRPVTNGINPFLAFMPAVREMKDAEPGTRQELGINTLMTELAAVGEEVVTSESVTRRIDESLALLDVAGYNYADRRYALDLAHNPHRLIVGTESDHARIAEVWEAVASDPRVLGDFNWTAWDYIGEAGIGRLVPEAEQKPPFFGPFPWRFSWAGDIDASGNRRSQSYYRETVWGLRSAPHIAVHDPDSLGTKPATGWGWTDSLNSWSWPGAEGRDIRVDVYSGSEEVELLLNGRSRGSRTVGEHRAFIASFTLPYEAGELVAVARTNGEETGRAELRSATEMVLLTAAVDRAAVRADEGDLAFIDISLRDEHGVVHTSGARAVTVSVNGAGVLQALGSADPRAEENYTGSSTRTFQGRALAVVRPAEVGRIDVALSSEGLSPVHLRIESKA